jgi:F420-dependent oxidoreductase-like protein
MQLRVMTEPQEGGTYDDLVRLAQQAERLGFDGFFRSDHLQRISRGDPGPGSTDAWTTLAGLARETTRLRLGTMVTSGTFRRPGLLAIMVATVDAMSGGRVELGLGSGWFETEHASYGIPFPSVGERFDVLEEQLELITGLWRTPVGESFSYTGTHYTLVDSPALPKPVQPGGIPIIVGGSGKTRTPELAVRFAQEFNMPPAKDLPSTAEQFDRVRAACEAADRDPASMVLSTAQPLVIGGDDREVAGLAAAAEWEIDDLRRLGLCGTAPEIVDKLGRLAELGSTRTYLQLQTLEDDDSLPRIAEEVAPHLTE